MIYFDNAATTQPCEEAVNAVKDVAEVFGNPSSLHKQGILADEKMKEARENIAKQIDATPEEIVFTSGGTESNNLALQGIIRGKRKLSYITSETEHPSIKEPLIQLEQDGHIVKKISVNEKGKLDVDELLDSITEETDLVSLIHANNETGVIFDVEEIGQAIKKKNKDTLYHVDGVQGFMKHPISVRKGKIDLYTASAHKVHGFKGCGFLYVSKDLTLKPMIYGGEQENEIRPGTENIAGISAFSAAVKNFKTGAEKEIKEVLLKLKELPDVYVNTSGDSSYIVNMSFVGIPSEILVSSLSSEGIYISAGAACSNKRPISLSYLGIDEKRANSAVRFSFSYKNTVEEAEKCVEVLQKLVPLLRQQIGN